MEWGGRADVGISAWLAQYRTARGISSSLEAPRGKVWGSGQGSIWVVVIFRAQISRATSKHRISENDKISRGIILK